MLKDFQPRQEGVRRADGGMTYSLPRPVPLERRPLSGGPYDLVGGYSSGGLTVMGRPRWQVDAEMRKAAIEAEKAEMELEHQRWMMEQMRRNPYGMNVRDLLSRIK